MPEHDLIIDYVDITHIFDEAPKKRGRPPKSKVRTYMVTAVSTVDSKPVKQLKMVIQLDSVESISKTIQIITDKMA